MKPLADKMAEQAALYEFTNRLCRATSAEEIYTAALDAILRALGSDRASILLFNDSGVMSFEARRGLSERYRVAVKTLALDARVPRRALPRLASVDFDGADFARFQGADGCAPDRDRRDLTTSTLLLGDETVSERRLHSSPMLHVNQQP